MDYESLIRKQRAWYKAVKSVYCPLLQEDVHFTSKGFRHLRYDGHGKARSKKEIRYRLNLLPLAIPVIRNVSNIYRYEQVYSKPLGKYVEKWGLKETVGRSNAVVIVVLRRIGTGKISFYSIMKKSDKRKPPHG